MKKLVIAGVIGLIICGGAGGYFIMEQKRKERELNAIPRGADSYKNATYTVEGKEVRFKNGTSEISVAPGSASKTITQFFGNEASYDFDGDGRQDIVFLITQSTGGSGTFYYVVVALNKETGYFGSHATLLGDRVSPQTTEVTKDGLIVINYADRAPSESFSVPPSVGKTLRLKFNSTTMDLGEVVANFEGEADPNTMNITMKKWLLMSASYSNDTPVTFKKKNLFTITFLPDNTFSATTDCNTINGKYMVSKEKISLTSATATKKFCEGSEEDTYSKLINEISSYHFTGKGELVFDLNFDSGVVVFK